MTMSLEEVMELGEQIGRARSSGFIGFTSDKEIQMNESRFLESFDTYHHSERGCPEYPHELSVRKDGVKFFTVLSNNEYKDLGGEEK